MTEIISMFNPRNWDLGVFTPFLVFLGFIVLVSAAA